MVGRAAVEGKGTCTRATPLPFDAVLVRIELPVSISLEPFKVASKLGRFILRDEGVPRADALARPSSAVRLLECVPSERFGV